MHLLKNQLLLNVSDIWTLSSVKIILHRWMIEYEAPVKWQWRGKTEWLGEEPLSLPFSPWARLEMNTGLHEERPATNLLRHGTPPPVSWCCVQKQSLFIMEIIRNTRIHCEDKKPSLASNTADQTVTSGVTAYREIKKHFWGIVSKFRNWDKRINP